jgi:TrmH family RNA methyltransferase
MTKAEIQLIRSLEDKRAREETGLFVAEGEKIVQEMLASNLTVRKVYTTNPYFDGEEITPKEMERISHLKTPSELLALVEIPRWEFDPGDLPGRLTLALDGVQNPGNLGTIIRLADWFYIHNVLCSADCADCWSPKVVQATMGAITRVKVHYGDLEQMVAKSVDAAGLSAPDTIPVYGTYMEGESVFKADLTPGGIIMFGSEGRGISDRVGRLVTRRIVIPTWPYYTPPSQRGIHPSEVNKLSPKGSKPRSKGPESLNVSVAAAIVCAEFRRREM